MGGVTVVLYKRGVGEGLHIYSSVQGEAGVNGGGEQRAGLLHRGSARDDCRGPVTRGGAEVRGSTRRRGAGCFNFSFSVTLSAG